MGGGSQRLAPWQCGVTGCPGHPGTSGWDGQQNRGVPAVPSAWQAAWGAYPAS